MLLLASFARNELRHTVNQAMQMLLVQAAGRTLRAGAERQQLFCRSLLAFPVVPA